jgi:hypothetical protein
LIHEKEQKLNKLEKENIIPKCKFASFLYYRKDHENEEFEQKAQNFEPLIHYVVEQEVVIQGIRIKN